MTETKFNEINIEERKEECSMLNGLMLDQEFIPEKLDVMTEAFVKCIIEISKTSTNIDEEVINSIVQILHLKYFTNMPLSDDFVDIIESLRPIENQISSIMQQFPETELLKALDKIKSTSSEVERQIQELTEHGEYAGLQ